MASHVMGVTSQFIAPYMAPLHEIEAESVGMQSLYEIQMSGKLGGIPLDANDTPGWDVAPLVFGSRISQGSWKIFSRGR